MPLLPETKTLHINKRNRIKKLTPKKHKITHEYGRSTKTLWKQIVLKATNK